MNKFSRRFFLGAGTAALAVGYGRVSRSSQFSLTNTTKIAQGTKELNIYSSRHYNTDDKLYGDFAEQNGVRINLIEGNADELIERIKSEGANSPADILITVDAGRLWRAEQAGIFAPIESEILTERIPGNLRHPNNLWFGFSKRARVIMYNKDTVDPANLSTYEALADPQWQDRIGVRSSSNIYNQSLVAGMIEVLGLEATEEWCRGFVDNFARPPQGNDTSQIEAVAAGIIDLTLANTYYLPRYEDEPAVFDRVKVFFPNQDGRGTHVNISGGGVTQNAPNRETAIAFLEYLSSPTAQEFFALGNNEYPVVPGTPVADVVASFGDFKEDTVNVSAYGRNNDEAVRIMDRAGWK